MNLRNWICCQIGAREHYAIPRALVKQGRLAGLITDVWVEPRLLKLLPANYLASWRSRFHPELADTKVCSFNRSLYQFELSQKIARSSSWRTIVDRNQWFQARALEVLSTQSCFDSDRLTLFAYSYAALELFKYAKHRGWRTVLGQIDAGITHQEILDREANRYPHYQQQTKSVPNFYWRNWLAECRLADHIIVNSNWSKQALEQQQIPSSKIETIPLAYQFSTAKQFTKVYPQKFTCKRPLKVLYLGRVTLGKGIAALFEAIEMMQTQPIEFQIVGSLQINVPPHIKANTRVKFLGSVPRNYTYLYYQQADVFIFPTLSDGFGLTQLEAQAWKLPVIASRHCGAVVKDRINGLILPNITAADIAKTLTFCRQNPEQLSVFSQNSPQILADFSQSNLIRNLMSIDAGLHI